MCYVTVVVEVGSLPAKLGYIELFGAYVSLRDVKSNCSR